MKYQWLNHRNNSNLIIFFNGWGMDNAVVKHLKSENYNVLMFYDYNLLETDFDFESLSVYKSINLIAWSMGVMLGSIFSTKIKNITHSVAINGTLYPISSDYGIHPRIYDLTIKGFNENGRVKFISTMFDKVTELEINRNIENQKTELIALKNYSPNEDFTYKKVLISEDDKIIPTKNQCRFWGIEPNLKGGHCPFFQFKNWGELL